METATWTTILELKSRAYMPEAAAPRRAAHSMSLFKLRTLPLRFFFWHYIP